MLTAEDLSFKSTLPMFTPFPLQFWTGYQVKDSRITALDGSDTAYISQAAEGLASAQDQTCVFGHTRFGHGLPNFNSTDCSAQLPFICKISPCSVCDTCIESWFDQVVLYVSIHLALMHSAILLIGTHCSRSCYKWSLVLKTTNVRVVCNMMHNPTVICSPASGFTPST